MDDIKKLHEKPPYAMIAILFCGAFIAFLNNTLLNVALPSIMTEFQVSPAIVQWLTNGYMLVNGILIPARAFFIQKFTNRKLFLTAMSLFSLGTLLAAISPHFGFLIAGRMIQASGSSLLMPLLMNVMLIAFPIERRGRAMGVFGLVMTLAPAIGPTLSGWIIEHYSWRMLFWIIFPFTVLFLLLGLLKLKNITPNRDIKIEVVSLIYSTLAFGGLLYGFSSAGEIGWKKPAVFVPIAVGAIFLVLFIGRQLRLREPMLEFRIFKYPMFALSSTISIVLSASMFSGMILTPIYVQSVRGISPFDAGLLMLPGAIVMGIMSPITGKLFDKYGPRMLATVGLLIMAITTYMFSRLTLDMAYFTIMLLYTVRMFGMSLVMMPVMTNGLNQLPMIQYPHGTAMNNTLQQVSGAIGSAILVTLMNKKMELSKEQLVNSTASASSTAASEDVMIEITNQAMLDGINFAFLISTFIAILAFILSLFMKRVVPEKKMAE